jgi:hypothetical protein
VNIEEFYGDIRQQIRGCPSITLKHAVRRAARIFCRKSWYVQRHVEVALIAGERDYTLAFSDDEEAIGVRRGTVDNVPVFPMQLAQFDPNTGTGSPRGFAFEPLHYLSVFPTPGQDYDGVFQVATQPKAETDVIADEIGQNYLECIGYGALNWLHSMPQQVWTDPNAAFRAGQLFSAGITNAKGEQMRGFQASNLRVAIPRFAIR